MPDPYDKRRRQVLAEFDALAQKTFAAHPKLNSAIFAVAQYWNDEASDAVHHMFVWSSDDTPEWPHQCEWQERWQSGTGCASCLGWDYRSAPRLSWDDNHEAIEPFAPFCKPGSHQEMEASEAYAPYAIARRGLPPVIVGEVRQPDWMAPPVVLAEDEELAALLAEVYAAPDDDHPRRVLADWLQDYGDPRGAFIAAQVEGGRLGEAPGDIWWPAYEVTDRIEYSRGFPVGVQAFLENRTDIIQFANHPAWATVKRIDFMRSDHAVVTEAMSSADCLRGLNSEALWRMSGPPWIPLVEVQVFIDWVGDFRALQKLSAFSVAHLEIWLRSEVVEQMVANFPREPWRIEVGRVTVRHLGETEPPVGLLEVNIRAERWTIEQRFES